LEHLALLFLSSTLSIGLTAYLRRRRTAMNRTTLSLCFSVLMFLPSLALAERPVAPALGFTAEFELSQIQAAVKTSVARWVAGPTSMLELSPEERRFRCSLRREDMEPPDFLRSRATPATMAVTDSAWDWRSHDGQGYVTTVKDQGGCGSCWAFGALGSLESLIKIYFSVPSGDSILDPFPDLSEQELVSCKLGGHGCSGYSLSGTCSMLQQDGVGTEDCLSYLASDLIPCDATCPDREMRERRILSYRWVLDDVNSIKAAILSGPVYVAFDVYSDFMSYSGGVYEHVWGGYEGGHAVVMVGWNDADSCWICKNSWGTGWGEAWGDQGRGWFRIKWGECSINDFVYAMVPADAEYPKLDLAGKAVTSEPGGDGDGVVNPGEKVRLSMFLFNEPTWLQATGVTGILRSSDPRLVITDSTCVFPDISSGDTVVSLDDLEVQVPDSLGSISMVLLVGANPGSLPYSVEVVPDLEVTLNQAGWPVPTVGFVESSPVLMDLDGDEQKEVIVGCDDGKLYVKRADGSNQPGFPFATGNMILSSPAVGDLNSDGQLDIVVGSTDRNIYFLRADGNLLVPPILTTAEVKATPVLKDLDGDDSLEVIVGTYDGKLYVLRHDGSSYGPSFPYDLGSAARINGSVAVADLDADGNQEIVLGTYDHKVYAISSTGTPLGGSWPFTTGGVISSEPSIANLDGSGLRVVVGSWDKKLYVLNADGSEHTAITTGGRIRCSPSFADLDEDRQLEIVFGSDDGSIYACNPDGSLVDG
jgi:hypothetical protein